MCESSTRCSLVLKCWFALWITIFAAHFSCVSCPPLSAPGWIHEYKPYDDGYCYASGYAANRLGSFQINKMIAEAEAEALGLLAENVSINIEHFGVWQKVSAGDNYKSRSGRAIGRLFWTDVVVQGYERVSAWFTGSGGGVWDAKDLYVLVRIPCGRRQLEMFARRAGFQRIGEIENE